jgi:MoaA/NifB/PqqE/SkfB family radical SAM enzyme
VNELLKETQKDAERIYYNLLKKRAKKIGLSQVRLQRLIKEHFEKIFLNKINASLPAYVDVEVTARCNAKCSFCYGPKIGSPSADLPADFWMKTFDSLKARGVKGIVICGGEPTLHKDILAIIRHAKDIGLFVVLATNGVNRSTVLECAALVDWIALPLDAIPEKLLKTVRGRICINIDQLESLVLEIKKINPKIKIKIGTVVTRVNLERIIEVGRNLLTRQIPVESWEIYQYVSRRKSLERAEILTVSEGKFNNEKARIMRDLGNNSEFEIVFESVEDLRKQTYLMVYSDGDLVVPNVGEQMGDLVLGNLCREEELLLKNTELSSEMLRKKRETTHSQESDEIDPQKIVKTEEPKWGQTFIDDALLRAAELKRKFKRGEKSSGTSQSSAITNDEKSRMIRKLYDNDEIVVQNNKIGYLPRGPVVIRACSLPEVGDNEADDVAEALDRWFYEAGMDVIHPDVIRSIQAYLKTPRKERNKLRYNIYLAISDRDGSGKRCKLRVEGIIVIEQKKSHRYVRLWETKPDNRYKQVDKCFVNEAGEQLLRYAISREYNSGLSGLGSMIYGGDGLPAFHMEGLSTGRLNTRKRIEQYLNDKALETYLTIEHAANRGMQNAVNILKILQSKESQLLIGLETGWLPDSREDTGLIRVLNELSRIANERKLDNIIIRRGNGTRIAREIRREAAERNIPNSNIIFLGRKSVFESRAFDTFRGSPHKTKDGRDIEAETNPDKWAFFAGIELPEGMERLPEDSYVRVLEMLTKAMNLWANKPVELRTDHLQIIRDGKRVYRFVIPNAEILDSQLLKEIYSGQLRAMKSA